MTPNFTILMCIRGTERELKFMEKSIPSIIKLNSDDVMFGVDEDTDIRVKNKIETICKDHNFTNYRIIEVSCSKEWKMQMAHVVWTCYNEAKYDKIFHCDVDTTLQKDVLVGRDIVGRDNVALCSFTTKLLVRNFGEWRREFFYRRRVKLQDNVFSGVYWVYRPYYFNNINKADYMKINNGIDTYMYETITKNKTHNIVTRKEIGSHQMDLASNDYPWRHFSDGMWWFAFYNKTYDKHNKKTHNVKNLNKNLVGTNIKNLSKIVVSSVFNNDKLLAIERLILIPYYFIHKMRGTLPLGILKVYAWKYATPGLIDGYKWAQKNKDSEIIKQASKLTLSEWGYLGGKVIKPTGKKFEREDGTGFV